MGVDPRSMFEALTGSLLYVGDDCDAEQVGRFVGSAPQLDLTVIRARSLQDALQIVTEARHRGQPDLTVILSDLSLPDATEIEAVQILAQHAPHLPLIVQIGDDDPHAPVHALSSGAHDYLIKDAFDADMLQRSIRYALIRHETLRALRRETEARNATDSDLDDFAHLVAHDLRAPVRTARLFADRLLNKLDSTDAMVATYGDRLDESLGRVDQMILSMLEYAALRGDTPHVEDVPLHILVQDICQLVDDDLEALECEVSVDIDESIIVHADPELLRRVGHELITNAVKYRRVDVPLEVEVRASARRGRVRIDVVDNGIGVPPEANERVFRLLERLDTSASTGVGFGLAICRRIITKSGGTIVIEPTEPPGTTIVIDLPGRG